MFRPRAKLIKYSDPLGDAEVRDAFSSITGGSPFWQALDQVIDQTLLDMIDRVSDPAIAETPGKLAHAGGGVDAISTLKAKIQRFRSLDTDLG
tara:strand:+ start:168 stop:446 length:279 start_codon:yes stop_codon:yes gene_type:complete